MAADLTWPELTPHLRGLASVATVSASGGPHVAIVSPAVVDGTIWFGALRSSAKAANIAATGTIALVWSADGEAYVWGAAEIVDDVETKRSMWTGTWAYEPGGFFGTPDNPDYVLVRVTPQRAMLLTAGPDGPTPSRWIA